MTQGKVIVKIKECVALLKEQKFQDCIEQAKVLLSSAHSSDEAGFIHAIIAECYLNLKKHSQAQYYYQKVVTADPTNAGYFYNYALSFRRDGLYRQAIENYKKAISLDPKLVPAYRNLIAVLTMVDKKAEAIQYLKQALALVPNDIALQRVAFEHMKAEGLKYINIETLKDKASKSTQQADKIQANYLLAGILDYQKEHTMAWDYITIANQLQSERFDIAKDARYINNLIETFNVSFMQSCPSGQSDYAPIFIMGLPRAGKTQLEIALAETGLFYAGGEMLDIDTAVLSLHEKLKTKKYYPMCMSQYTQGVAIHLAEQYHKQCLKISDSLPVINTLPGNIYHVGLIMSLFPKAKFILLERDKIDHIIEIYFKYFARGNLYANDLSVLTQYYSHIQQLKQHWQKVFPQAFIRISFEDMVNHPDTVSSILRQHLHVDQDLKLTFSAILKESIGHGSHYRNKMETLFKS